jgi:muramoyltetrapeptide carboxypeptidase
MHTVLPKKLGRKATIGIIAPASPQRDPVRLERGIAYLESLGHTVVLGPHVHNVHNAYLAGTDEERLADLHAMFADKRIDAIMCSRGGYGTGRILDKIDYRLIRRNPKIFVGFSDITALQLAMYKRTGLVTFSGAMPGVDMADGFAPESEEWFWRALQHTKPLGAIKQPWPTDRYQAGTATGTMLAGNLSVLITLLGTAFLPSTKGAVLLLEDIGEDTYRIDRMLNQLRLAGVLGSAAGVAFGQWTQGETGRTTPHRPVQELIAEVAQHIPGPVIGNVMYGHTATKLTVPIGVRAQIGGKGAGLRFLDAAVQA